MIKTNKRMFAEIAKTEEQDDGTLKVWGYASSPGRDSDGEIVTADAMRAALPDYMKFGAVREMHQPSAAGTAIEATVGTDDRTWFGAHIVDAEAVKKVQAKVYKGFSIGGKVLERDPDEPDTITAIKLVEISLVDRPANPDAVFTMFKAEDAAPAATPEQLDAISQLTELVNKGDVSPADLVRLAEEHLAKSKGADSADDGEGGTAGEPEIEEKAAKPDEHDGSTDNADENMDDCDGMKAMKPDDLAKGLIEISKALRGAKLTKGLRGINSLSSAIYQLVAVQAGVKREADEEGDNSAVPGQIAEGLKTLLDALAAMAQEETRELMADLEQAGMEEAVPDWGSFAYAAAVIDMAKAAPKSDLAKADTSASSAALLAKFAGLEAENAALAKRVADLEAQPAPPKGALLTVSKSQDIVKGDSVEEDTPPAGLSPEQAALWEMKKVHRAGGFRLR